MRGGLAWLNTESRKRFGKNLSRRSRATSATRSSTTSRGRERAKPEFSHGVSVLQSASATTSASGFFSSAMGWKDLQYEGNVFNPNWHGCPEPAMEKLGVSHELMDTRIKPDQPTG